jgi:squalene cyclase
MHSKFDTFKTGYRRPRTLRSCRARALVALFAVTGPVAAQNLPPIVEVGIAVPRETRRAITRGLDYLAAHQNANGSWTDRVGRKVHYSYEGEVTDHVGVTALAGMAFLANGSLPTRGPYAEPVRKALEYVLSHTNPQTGMIEAHGSRMYSHAFAALFLAEVYGMTGDPAVRGKLKLAVRCIVEGQNRNGGWRYVPGAPDADMSVTVCQVMALRAARNAGLQVPKETVDAAIEYVKKSFRPQFGAFTYQIEENYGAGASRHTFPLTACGVAALYGAGEYDAYEVAEGLEFMLAQRPARDDAAERFDYYYGQYYAVQAAFQRGGTYWQRWYEDTQRDLLSLQERTGSWRDLVGRNYATAMATIVLQMPFQYLPITER